MYHFDLIGRLDYNTREVAVVAHRFACDLYGYPGKAPNVRVLIVLRSGETRSQQATLEVGRALPTWPKYIWIKTLNRCQAGRQEET